MAELSLYDYQNEAIEELRKGFANGKRAQVLVSPTGSGKTEMAIALMAATSAKGNKTAMLLDRIVLCNQTSARLDRYGLDHGVYQADHWRNRPYEKIQVCSAQTMEALGVMPDVTLLIIDECHTIRTKTAAYIKSNLKLKVIGLTATPFTKGMGKIYDNVVSTVTTKQLVAREVLVPLRVFIAKEIDMEGAKKSGGEWTNSEATARGKKITGDVVAEWIKVTHKIFGRPRKTLVFCSGTEHGVDLARKFQEQGYNFIATSHKDPDEWRKEILREFAEPDSKIHGLIATDLYTKGLDIPDVMIGVSARPFSKSFSSHVQQMGRITRGNPGSDKSFAVWLDHSGNYLRFKDDWDEVYHNGVDELDDGKEKTKTEPTEFEKEAAKCPKCHALWAKGSDACYNCGFVREKQNTVYSVNGILTELQAPVIVKCDWDKQEFWSAMVWNMQHKGWKQGRAAKLFKDRFSEYQAPDLKNIPVKPSARIDLFAKNNLIAWQIKQKYLREHGR